MCESEQAAAIAAAFCRLDRLFDFAPLLSARLALVMDSWAALAAELAEYGGSGPEFYFDLGAYGMVR